MVINKIILGGGKIKDADALPEDVRIGKIAYNNDGKFTGVCDIEKDIILIATDKTIQSHSTGSYLTIDENSRPRSVHNSTSSFQNFSFFKQTFSFDYDVIMGITCDGIRYNYTIRKEEIAKSSFALMISAVNSSGYVYTRGILCESNGEIYMNSNTGTMTIHYK